MTKAQIFYYDIGDYLTRKKKLEIIKEFGSAKNVPWQILTPNEHGDWLNQRNDTFSSLIPLEPEKKFDADSKSFFLITSNGVSTARDSWVYNYSEEKLIINVKNSINFYNLQVDNYLSKTKKNSNIEIEEIIDWDLRKFKWDRAQKENDLPRGRKYTFDVTSIVKCQYRPFNKQIMYFNRNLNNCVYQVPKLFPTPNHKNLVICIEGTGSNRDFGCLIADRISDLGFAGIHTQCFPFYYYTKKENKNQLQGEFFEKETEYTRHNGISDFILNQAKERYGSKITREDIFYYVYGILHSPDYRKIFANDLKKMLPRLPLVENEEDFYAFSKAGRELAELHLNYEDIEPCESLTISGKESNDYKVNSMRFLAKNQKDAIVYNAKITISNIPLKAYEYVVNGKSAIEWVMERYKISIHKESGIENNPNDWAVEHNNPQYILNLLLSVITISVKTVEIVEALPQVEWG